MGQRKYQKMTITRRESLGPVVTYEQFGKRIAQQAQGHLDNLLQAGMVNSAQLYHRKHNQRADRMMHAHLEWKAEQGWAQAQAQLGGGGHGE